MDVSKSVDDDNAQLSAELIQRVWRGRNARTDLLASDALWRLTNVITEASSKEDTSPVKPRRDFRRQLSQRDTKKDPRALARGRDRPPPWSRASVARRLKGLSQKSLSHGSMSQSNGDLGVARIIDDLLLAPLVYRLVALNADKAWGTGKLVQLAEKSNSDEQLAQELSVLLSKLWRDDPIRAKSSRSSRAAEGSDETWADVLLEGRGTVGETVLHLVFLLNTPACRRLIRFLVPYLAHKRTTDVFGHKVIDPPTLPIPPLRPIPPDHNLGHRCALSTPPTWVSHTLARWPPTLRSCTRTCRCSSCSFRMAPVSPRARAATFSTATHFFTLAARCSASPHASTTSRWSSICSPTSSPAPTLTGATKAPNRIA